MTHPCRTHIQSACHLNFVWQLLHSAAEEGSSFDLPGVAWVCGWFAFRQRPFDRVVNLLGLLVKGISCLLSEGLVPSYWLILSWWLILRCKHNFRTDTQTALSRWQQPHERVYSFSRVAVEGIQASNARNQTPGSPYELLASTKHKILAQAACSYSRVRTVSARTALLNDRRGRVYFLVLAIKLLPTVGFCDAKAATGLVAEIPIIALLFWSFEQSKHWCSINDFCENNEVMGLLFCFSCGYDRMSAWRPAVHWCRSSYKSNSVSSAEVGRWNFMTVRICRHPTKSGDWHLYRLTYITTRS